MSNLIKIVFAIAVIVFLIAVGPLLTIWAVNTLFPVVAIPYTFDTWAAVVLLGAFLRAKVSVSK